MAKRKITQLDLFSGIGGFHLGFERAGYEVKSYFSEIDKHAVAVYKQQFKDAEYVGSVTDVRGAELPRIDLITFGSPCQDFSLAGKRKGMQGDRSSLVLESIRLINECRPSVFIWENVKGTFSSNAGADFWAIIQAFANIGGYRLEWQLLNTSWFLPQNRERIYLVGYLAEARGDWGGVFPIGESTGKSNELERQQGIANCLHTKYQNLGNGAYIGERELKEDIRIKVFADRGTGGQQGLVYDDKGIAACINSSTYKDPMMIKETLKVKNATSKETIVEPKIVGYTRDAKGKVTDRHLKDEAGTIHSSSGGGGNTDQFVQDVKVGTWRTHKDGQGFREVKGGNCPTIPARAREDGSGQPVIKVKSATSKEAVVEPTT